MLVDGHHDGRGFVPEPPLLPHLEIDVTTSVVSLTYFKQSSSHSFFCSHFSVWFTLALLGAHLL